MSTTPLSESTQVRLVPAERFAAITSLIGEGAVFEGDFSTNKDLGLRVDGRIKGAVRIERGGAIHIGPTGVVEGTTLEADHVLIEGRVFGVVVARKTLEITGSGTLFGEAHYDGLLDVHPRARIRGAIDFRGEMDAA